MVSNNIGKFKLIGIKNYETWKEYEKTIPFTVSYNHLGYSWNPTNEKLEITVHTKRCECYKLVEKWFKEQQNQQINEESKREQSIVGCSLS